MDADDEHAVTRDKITKAARGRDCQVRLPGVCNGNPETTCLAHFRLSGISGIGFKAPNIIGAWACSSCHSKVDSDKSTSVQLAFAHGVIRTLNTLWSEGIIRK